MDLSLNQELVERLEAFARVGNVLDEDYQLVVGYNTAGRAFMRGFVTFLGSAECGGAGARTKHQQARDTR